MLLANVPVRAAGTDWYVNATSGNDSWAGTIGSPKKTIQAGITVAGFEDIVNVAAGTYYENISISKALTVRSDSGAATTIIDCNNGNPYVVCIDASNVTFDGFTVTSPGYTDASDASGIVVEPGVAPSNVRVTNCIVHDIGVPNRNPVPVATVGINIGGLMDGIEIDNNEIYNIKHADVGHDSWANGICIWGSDPSQLATNVNVHDNYIHDIDCPKPRAAGISLQPDVDSITLSNNRIVNTKDYGIELRGGSHNPTVVQGNTIDGTGANGINYGVRCSDPYPANVTGNTITACNTGVWATNPESIWSQPPATTPLVQLNKINGNHSYGMDNLLSGATTATKNWWGSVYGPWSASHPAGDKINGSAGSTPWCTNAALTEIVSFPLHVKTLMTTGIFAIPTAVVEASTPYIKAADRVVIDAIRGSATHTITLPTDTILTKASGASIDTGDLLATYVPPETLSGFEPGAIVRAGVQWGIPGETVNFSKPIAVRLYVGPGLEGRRLNIYRSVTGSTGWTSEGIATVAPRVSGGFVTFQATKASYYAAVSPPRKAVGSSFYFAEGYTGAGFDEYLSVGNPNAGAATVNVTYMFADGTTKAVSYKIPAQSRYTVNVNSEVGPGREVSLLVQSTSANLVAERPMYFDYTNNGSVSWTGGHDVVGATAPGLNWYFAEGFTGHGFDEYVCVLNPGDAAAALVFRFQTQESGAQVKTGYSVPAHSRSTFKVNDILGSNYQSSLKLESDRPVVAERSMYFDYSGVGRRDWTGGSCVMGAPAPAKRYYFAEGTTRNVPGYGEFEEWLTLQNTNASPITIDATYQLGEDQGENVTRSYVVEAGTRQTVYVPSEVGENKDVSVLLTCSSDFLAERPLYFNYGGAWTGGDCVIGSTSTGTRWFFAEGYTGQNFQEWLTLQNPGTQDSSVEITYFTLEAGAKGPYKVNVPAGTRYTVNVNEQAGAGLQLSAQIVSDKPVVAERPMYFNYNGAWTGGHDVLGKPF